MTNTNSHKMKIRTKGKHSLITRTIAITQHTHDHYIHTHSQRHTYIYTHHSTHTLTRSNYKHSHARITEHRGKRDGFSRERGRKEKAERFLEISQEHNWELNWGFKGEG